MPIRRALISVSDKTGIVDFAKGLAARDVVLMSTGGTFRALEEAGIPVQTVESYTGSPEVMDGRVKTLHPRVHGGILARGGKDETDLERIGGQPIDMVIVNLYPFEQTLAREGASFDELIENIDIGGPSMLRSAAKNHARVAVVSDPADYDAVLGEIEATGSVSVETREALAAKAFAQTAAYDGAISGWLSGRGERDRYPKYLSLAFEKAYPLRYGENPHQTGAFYRQRSAPAGSVALAENLGTGAKELSFNNLVDVEAAAEAVRELPEPGAVVIKHTSPCGAATARTLARAYLLAREADAQSAFGGIVALNREVDEETAETISETFIECVVAPGFSEAALDRLRKKKALRLLATGQWLPPDYVMPQFKRIGGGLVVQARDDTAAGEVRDGEVVTDRKPTEAELGALEFAWAICKHVKSNSILLAAPTGEPGEYVTLGSGGGQTSRVGAAEIAIRKAGDRARGAVLASDAFFPFPDGLEVGTKAGVTAIAQPGGSKGDEAVIQAANAAGAAMVFTGIRHFRH